MSFPEAALSDTLKSITVTKVNQLEIQRTQYAARKNAILQSANAVGISPRDSIIILLKGVEDLKLQNSLELSTDLWNIRRWVEQSEFDASLPADLLQTFQAELRARLGVQTRKLDLASLYSRLLIEWMNPKAPPSAQVKDVEMADSLEDSFEVIEKDRLKQLQEKFSDVVFTALETDEEQIEQFLGGLFPGESDVKALEALRGDVRVYGSRILQPHAPFVEKTIKWCIKGLLASDLLSDAKRSILQDFLNDEVARAEICDVLNMKFRDFENWQWDAGEEGMKVEPRKQLNGKWRVMMDEDVLQALFLHYLGMMWAVGLNGSLVDCLTRVWKPDQGMPQDTKDERIFFLGNNRVDQETKGGISAKRAHLYQRDIFLSQLPASVLDGAGGYDDDDEEDIDNDGWGGRETVKRKKSPKEIKQQLLRQLATEVVLRKAVDGKAVVLQSDFKWFGTGIPQSTIFAVMKFVGMPEIWISFFEKFLSAPLNMGDGKVQIRQRGMPMAHSLERVIGELVLFFLDLAVIQKADMPLQRFHDDLWLVGEPAKAAQGWKTLEEFTRIMGLELNPSKTGSVFLNTGDFDFEDSEIMAKLPAGRVEVGFLELNPGSGEWEINQGQVDTHVQQLSKQLNESSSILDWVRIWNSCMGRFFSHTFGEPASCFGRAHVHSILRIYQRMQERLFPGGNVCEHLKGLIKERFEISDVPDAFIFLPEALGGLGLRNPFISPLLVQEDVLSDPAGRMTRALKEERLAYEDMKKRFIEMNESSRQHRLNSIFGGRYTKSLPSWADEDYLNTFMSYEYFSANRESTSPELLEAYEELMDVPCQKGVVVSGRVKLALSLLGRTQEELKPSILDVETKWQLQVYEKELFERYGGLNLVEKDLLPLGVLKILRKRKAAWQMVL